MMSDIKNNSDIFYYRINFDLVMIYDSYPWSYNMMAYVNIFLKYYDRPM